MKCENLVIWLVLYLFSASALSESASSQENISKYVSVTIEINGLDESTGILKEAIDLEHVQIKPLSHTEFHHDLKSAYGVISNAGFELASECLTLGKKLLIKPLLGQYEQESNALALQCMSRATIIDKLDQHVLAQWLEREDHKPIRYPNVAKHLAHWIQQGKFDNVEQLVDSVWSETGFVWVTADNFPTEIKHGLIY